MQMGGGVRGLAVSYAADRARHGRYGDGPSVRCRKGNGTTGDHREGQGRDQKRENVWSQRK